MNFYKSAALALDHLDKHQGSVKGSLAAAGVKSATPGETKRVLALVIETLKYRPVLQQLSETVPLFSLERLTFPKKTPPHTPKSQSLILVLLHDLLFSFKLRIEASDKWPPKEAILRHQARLKAELVRIQIREGKSRKEDLGKKSGAGGEARYVRWNPNVDLHREGDWSLRALFDHLETILLFKRLEEAVYPVPDKSYFLDPHLPECLLVFPASSSWWVGDKWYKSGAVILQDKASCFPAKVLMEGWEAGEGECLDATAAPGNKTSYVSALMGNQGKLHAFERSHLRYKTLEKMLSLAHCKNVEAQRADFLEADPRSKRYAKVTRILLDPSCSGSGIVNRLDYLVDEASEETDVKTERLEKLASFQLQMILHAFKFPAAQRITYSTCSIHPEEDEQVVMKALAKQDRWELAPRTSVLPAWERRGRPSEMGDDPDMAESVIRCLPGQDKTNGFFVACFVRRDASAKPHRKALSNADKPSEGGVKTKLEKESIDLPSQAVKASDIPHQPKKSVTKRALPDDNDDDGNDGADDEDINLENHESDTIVPSATPSSTKPKTPAQLERHRRKKQQQKKRKVANIDHMSQT